MHRIALLSVALLTLALAAPGAAEEPGAAGEPGEAAEQSPAEFLEQLNRYQGELTERLQQQIEGRIKPQLSNAREPGVRGHHAARATGASVARSR